MSVTVITSALSSTALAAAPGLAATDVIQTMLPGSGPCASSPRDQVADLGSAGVVAGHEYPHTTPVGGGS
jgi:hypothetical protein